MVSTLELLDDDVSSVVVSTLESLPLEELLLEELPPPDELELSDDEESSVVVSTLEELLDDDIETRLAEEDALSLESGGSPDDPVKIYLKDIGIVIIILISIAAVTAYIIVCDCGQIIKNPSGFTFIR